MSNVFNNPEEFIKVYLLSGDDSETAEKLGLATSTVANYAYKYRELGIKLNRNKDAYTFSQKNIDKYNKLIKSLHKTNSEEGF